MSNLSDKVQNLSNESYLESYQTLSEEHVTFPVKDEKGRQMGMNVSIERQTYIPYDPAVHKACWSVEPGTYYVAHSQVTRDGKRFGNRGEKRAATAQAAHDAVAKIVRATRKRYYKKYGKVS